MAAGSSDERRLADLRASNERREEALHARGKCTHDSIPAVRSTAKLDVLLEHFGLETAAELRVEKIRARGYDEIERRMREEELSAGTPKTNGRLLRPT